MNKILNYDKDNGLITVEPGVSIAQILEIILTDNWTISANPGSFDVTIGGAISNNIHGKDSYSEGNFISNVKLINVLLLEMKLLVLEKKILNCLIISMVAWVFWNYN